MSSGDKLLKNTIVYSIGTVGSKLLAFLLLPIFSFFLEKDELGVYDIVLTTVILLVPIVSFQLSEATFRWLLPAGTTPEDDRAAVSSSFFLLSTSTLIIGSLFMLGSLYYGLQYSGYYLLMGLGAVYFPFFQQVVRGLGNNRLYAAAGVMNAACLVLFNTIFLIFLGWNLAGVFIATILAYFISALFIFFLGGIGEYITLKAVSAAKAKVMLAYSYPLIPNAASWWLINSANKYIILIYLGTDANGLFAISSRFPAILTIINSMFMLAWQDHAISTEDRKEALTFAGNVFNKLMRMEFMLVVVFALLSEPIVRYLIDPDFYEAWRYMPLLFMATAMAAFSAYIGAFYLKAKQTKGIFTTTIVGGIVNIVVTVFTIEELGLVAPALGTLVGFTTVFILRYKQSRKFYPFKVDETKFVVIGGICLSGTIISTIDIGLYRYILILCSFVGLYLVNKDSIESLFTMVNKKNRT